MTKKAKKRSGFTLIEVVIYLALFAILFSGAVLSAYTILESSAKNRTQAMIQEEGEFLLAKINWAVSNASVAQVPAGGQLSATVSGSDLVFAASGTDVVLRRYDSSGALVSEQPLNNGAVRVKNLFFVDVAGAASGVKGINYGFGLESNTTDGKLMAAEFASTAYLRK